jgi:hypothetical protein
LVEMSAGLEMQRYLGSIGALALMVLIASCSNSDGGDSMPGSGAGAPDAGAADAGGQPSVGAGGAGVAGVAGIGIGGGDPCAALSLSECANAVDVCGTIRAGRIQGDPECSGSLEAVGCYEIAAGCDDAITRAADPNGANWLFRSGCVPQGWQIVHLATPVPACTGAAGDGN